MSWINKSIRLGGKLIRDVLDVFTSWEKAIHRNHPAFDMKGRGLAAVAKGVSKTEKTAKGVTIRTEVGEKGGGFGRGEAADHLLCQSLIHKRSS